MILRNLQLVVQIVVTICILYIVFSSYYLYFVFLDVVSSRRRGSVGGVEVFVNTQPLSTYNLHGKHYALGIEQPQ